MMAAVQMSEQFWTAPSSTRRLFYRSWTPPDANVLLVIVHGFAEHSARYGPIAETLAAQQIAVVCADLWGHGRSSGCRGDVESFSDYVDGLAAVAEQVWLEHAPQQRLALFGHSLGGLIAIHWALRHPEYVRSLTVQSPLLGVGFPVPAWKQRLAGGLRALWPRLNLATGLNPEWLSHDPHVVEAYRRDPLVYRTISLRAYLAIDAAMRQALKEADRLARPTLLLYGAEDRVVSVSACQRFYERLACEKRLVGFAGCYHELHHEDVLPQVLQELTAWISGHG